MKHLKGWSFRDLERELREQPGVPPLHPLRCRGYARFHDLQPYLCSAQPGGHCRDSSAGGRPLACQQGVARGDKLRTDTTVVESNVHYPTDSSLLGDGIRNRSAAACSASPASVRTEPWKWSITGAR